MKTRVPTCLTTCLGLLGLAATGVQADSPFKDLMKGIGFGAASNLAQTAAGKIQTSVLRILGDDTNALASGNLLISKEGAWQPATNAADLQEAVKRQYAVRTATNERKTLASGTLVLPEKIVIPRKNRSETLTANLALLVQESPLPWQSNAYTTIIRVGLQADGLKKPIALESPINLRLIGSNVAVQPAALTIQQLGVGGYAAATVSVARHDTSGEVTICSDLGQRSFVIPVRPRATALKIAASDNRVLGYGLGKVALTVWRLAEDQGALADGMPLTITLHADQGNLASTTVTIPAGESRGTAELRSAGLGPVRISAESGSAMGALDGVTFVFPIAFALAGMLGGCMGGTTRFLQHRRQARKSPLRCVAEGGIVGVLAVGAVTAGLVAFRFPASVVGTELGAFMVAAIGGYAGVPWFDRLTRLATRAQPVIGRHHSPA